MSKRKSRAVVPVRKPPLLSLSGAEVKLGEIIDGMCQRDHDLQTALRSGNLEVMSVALAAALARDPESAARAWLLFGKDLDAVNWALTDYVLDMVSAARALRDGQITAVRDDHGKLVGSRFERDDGFVAFFVSPVLVSPDLKEEWFSAHDKTRDHDDDKEIGDADSDDVSDEDALALAAEHGDCTFSEFAKLADEARAEEARCERELAEFDESIESLRPFMEHFPSRTVGEAMVLYTADLEARKGHA